MSAPIVDLADVSKDYHGLRPLRIERLSVAAGEPVAVIGLDQPAAEVFVDLVTGATLPDRGEVCVFGRPTSSIRDGADWLATIDRVGIVSQRAVLLDALSVIQNLALPFTLDIEPPPDEFRERAAGLAREVGLAEPLWSCAVAGLDALARARLRVGRALALDPAIVLLEHPTVGIEREEVGRFGAELRAMAGRRGAALVAATADEAFAVTVAARVLRLQPATGRLTERRGWLHRW